MMNKRIGLAVLSIMLCLGTCSMWRYNHIEKLKQQMTLSGIFPSGITAQDSALNLTGQALVLYHVTSEDYPELYIQRLQMQADSDSLSLSLKGIYGSIINYYQKTEPYAFSRQLSSYAPQQDLMTQPLITLALLEGNLADVNIFVKAYFAARNQIAVIVDISKGRTQKARFVSKFTPSEQEALLSQLKARKLTFQLDYISPDWQGKLDDYCLSKGLPFFVENGTYSFSF